MDKKKVFIVKGNGSYHRMFADRGWMVVTDLALADLIQFTGGEDVSPELYNQKKHPRTFSNPYRDRHELILFNIAKTRKIPMTGICRGAQFLNVMNGGSLWQDVDGHAITGTHEALDIAIDGRTINVTSTHHQMMDPSMDGNLLLISQESKSKEKFLTPSGKMFRVFTTQHDDDVEAVYYEENNCLCFQPHPEYTGFPDMTHLYFEYLEWFCMNKEERS